MLAIAPLRTSDGGNQREDDFNELFPSEVAAGDCFSDDFSGRTLLEDIDFDDIFVGFDDGDILPDLEVDPAEIFAEFSAGGEDEQVVPAAEVKVMLLSEEEAETKKFSISSQDDDVPVAPLSAEKDETVATVPAASSSSSEAERGRKMSKVSSHGKRKVKVDWTPELHRRFVQAVEQLGVDKAVPSRILELMGIDCLTRHNIASHLQKYRSHRKHLLAREAEAASWSQRRQIYAGGGAATAAAKRDMNHPWVVPTVGFPPHPVPTFRPLHVWGHPTMDQPMTHVWPKHLVRSPPPLPWLPQPTLAAPPPPDPSYWQHHYPRGPRDGWVPTTLTQGTPCYPPAMSASRFPSTPIHGVVPHPMFRPNCVVPPLPPPSKRSGPQPQLEPQPSNESIDAAIGDVLAKPWLPLPLGLKPPSLESVMGELQRQGVSNIPPPSR